MQTLLSYIRGYLILDMRELFLNNEMNLNFKASKFYDKYTKNRQLVEKRYLSKGQLESFYFDPKDSLRSRKCKVFHLQEDWLQWDLITYRMVGGFVYDFAVHCDFVVSKSFFYLFVLKTIGFKKCLVKKYPSQFFINY